VQYAAWRGESLSIAAGALPPGSAQKRAMLTESADWLSTSLSLGLFGDA